MQRGFRGAAGYAGLNEALLTFLTECRHLHALFQSLMAMLKSKFDGTTDEGDASFFSTLTESVSQKFEHGDRSLMMQQLSASLS